MQGYKIDLTDYKVKKARVKLVNNVQEVEEYEDDYKIKEVIANVMCHPSQEHKGFRFYTVAKVAEKINECKEDSIVLDSADYAVVKESFDSFKGYSKNDAKMIQRIYEPIRIELGVKQSEN